VRRFPSALAIIENKLPNRRLNLHDKHSFGIPSSAGQRNALPLVGFSSAAVAKRAAPVANFVSAAHMAKKHRLDLRQSYLRLAKRARREVSRLIHGRGHKQAMRYLRKMRTWAGRLVRDIERKIDGQPDLQHVCEPRIERVKQLLAQKPDDKNKIYALHALEVECIAKRKARTRYEFGVKTSIAVTNARADGGQFVLRIQALPGLPYDGHTLKGQIAQVERLIGAPVTRA
jgi:transposase, IS5 family